MRYLTLENAMNDGSQRGPKKDLDLGGHISSLPNQPF